MSMMSRRDLLKSAGMAAAAGAVAGTAAVATASAAAAHQAPAAPAIDSDVLLFFNAEESKFVAAAADRLIPADPTWGGAQQAGVLYYIDHQLASAYGAGARLYLDGPWNPQAPTEQGYQLKYTPAELYRTAIGEILPQVRKDHDGHDFWELPPATMDTVLSSLETGQFALPSLPSAVFFETLLANTIEGFFADPAYGGNRGMVGWRMVGFPGAYAEFAELVDRWGLIYRREPLSIATSPVAISKLARGG